MVLNLICCYSLFDLLIVTVLRTELYYGLIGLANAHTAGCCCCYFSKALALCNTLLISKPILKIANLIDLKLV